MKESMINEKKIEYLLKAHDELRGELKDRIKQRDNLAIQYIVIVGALFGVEFSGVKYAYFTALIIPLITLYFSIQIFSSYDVHDRLTSFIRNNIETKIGKELGINEDELCDYFWEQYCKKDRELHNVKMPGGRKSFFQFLIGFVPIICGLVFLVLSLTSKDIPTFFCYLISLLSTIIYLLWGYYYLYRFNKKPKIIEYKKMAECDYKRIAISTSKKRPAVFFDRDGTIHVDKVETTLEKGLELFKDTKDVVKYFHDKGYLIVIITNQSGIAKGHITLKEMHDFNTSLRKTIKYVDAIYYCPHKKEDNCNCMKPKTGMFDRAVMELNIDITKSYMIGDQIHDIDAALNAGIPKENRIFVSTGIYKNDDFNNKKDLLKKKSIILDSLSGIFDIIK